MTGILLAVKGAHETPHIRAHIGYARMPRGSSYVLDSYIDMILSKNDAYAADAACVTIITIKIRRYNVNKYRIKLKKLVISHKNW